MPMYRMKFVDDRGRDVLATNVDCQNDDRALEIARNLRSMHDVEIYDGAVCIGRVPAASRPR
jgi:hypothetical protein